MKLNKRAGANGCGFHQIVEDRIVGLKVRGVYENPAAAVLVAAHKKLEYLVSTREENEFKATLDNIRAYYASSSSKVTGWAKVTLYKGHIHVCATGSPYSLFNASMASFDADLGAFNQNASPGFIELYNLAQKTSHAVGHQAKRKAAADGAPKKKAKK